MTEALNKLVVRLTRAVQLPVVVGSVLLGAAIVFAAQWALAGHAPSNLWSLVPTTLALGVILITVFVRFRTI